MDNEIIIVKQLPIIEEQLKMIRESVEAKTASALAMVCSEDTVKEIKRLRADLGRDFKAFEDKRKEVKAAVLAPYEAFEAAYRENISNLYKDTDAKLKGKIDDTENAIKAQRAEEVEAFYKEYADSVGVDFVPFEQSGVKVTLSDSMKKMKEACSSFLDRVADDLYMIRANKDCDEIMVEYKKTLNLTRSVVTVAERKESIKQEAQRAAEREAQRQKEIVSAEKVIDAAEAKMGETRDVPPPAEAVAPAEEVLELTFTVRGTRDKLRKLKMFLIEGGYDYE